MVTHRGRMGQSLCSLCGYYHRHGEEGKCPVRHHLERIKVRMKHGRYQGDGWVDMDQARLEFGRWLVENGKVNEG